MTILRFLIGRPVLSIVLSLAIFILGLISFFELPISEYPNLTPPTIIVTAQFPGANPSTLSEVVAAPLEEQLVGLEKLSYMSSQATADGRLTTTLTFSYDTDLNVALQLVQNRVSSALSRLPEITQKLGVKVLKNTQELTMAVHLISPNKTYDELYLRNFAMMHVKKELAKIKGVDSVALFGSGEYAMRIWLNPERLAQRNLSPNDVVTALQEQNVQVSSGLIGEAPDNDYSVLQKPFDIRGQLSTPEAFGEVVIRTDRDGQSIFLKDIARIELGANNYGLKALLNNQLAVAMFIFQAPQSNAIDISDAARATMQELSKTFPEDIEFRVVYDPTVFVKSSMRSVFFTLIEALLLVFIVVILFLQQWRSSLIVLLTIPVSVVGTFFFIYWCGFSINTLTLFGLILAIGIVVDDAIVVVENVARHLDRGLPPAQAVDKSMSEVGGAIFAISATLAIIFVPVSFVDGLAGKFYSQFALTIAIAATISAFCALTLTPTLAAILLRPQSQGIDRVDRALHRFLGRFFGGFNRLSNSYSSQYGRHVQTIMEKRGKFIAIYLVLVGVMLGLVYLVPKGYLPSQDKQYLISVVQLNEGATLAQTTEVVKEMAAIGLKEPGVVDAVQFPGLSINGFTNSSSQGVVFFVLDSFSQRRSQLLSAETIARKLQKKFMNVEEAFVAIFPPPVILGLGNTGGFKLQLEDRGGVGNETLRNTVKAIQRSSMSYEELFGVYSNFNINYPQLSVDIDRKKLKKLGLTYKNVIDAIQIYFGSLYVNDFRQFGHVYQVILQADPTFRSSPPDLLNIKIPNQDGEMVPLSAVLQINDTFGPESSTRYNTYLSADINGFAGMGYTLGQAEEKMVSLLEQILPDGLTYEWTDLSYQDRTSSNSLVYVLLISILFVFLLLAAYYESWSLPSVVILLVPLSVLSAMVGVIMCDSDNNVFTQISLFVLAGLSCKNVILIVDFARTLEKQGKSHYQAALISCQLRLRPVLMTSVAFIAGVLPMVFSSGAGSEMRNVMGATVFYGMVGVTVFSLFFTPIFYSLVRQLEQPGFSRP